MTASMFPFLGYVGIVLGGIGYLPQIIHLIKEHCAACISIRSWLIWVVGALFIFIHAITGGDLVFKALAVVDLFFVTITLILTWRYNDQTCSHHQVKTTNDLSAEQNEAMP